MTEAERKIQHLVDEVTDLHAKEIKTHYQDCWKYHVGCLADRIDQILGEADD